MFNAKAEVPQKSVLQIKQDDKFFCRLLSKESSMANPSFRVTVAVPFVWESQPGTPKYTFSEDTLPPLTPPPSYHLNTINACKKPVIKKSSRSKQILLALLPKVNLKKMILSSPSSSKSSSSTSSTSSLSSSSSPWSSSSSSSGSSKVFPMGKHGRRRFLSYDSSYDIKGDNNEQDHGAGSPTSTLCFGVPRATTNSSNGFQNSYRRKA